MRTRDEIEANIQSGLLYDDPAKAQTFEQVVVELLLDIRTILLQMEICGHGTRGFCKDCVRNEFLSHPISVRDAGNS